jgi:hypothetical protein
MLLLNKSIADTRALKSILTQLGDIAQGALAEAKLKDNIITELRSDMGGPSIDETKDRHHLSKARIITPEIRNALKEQQEAKQAAQLAKENAKKNRQLKGKSPTIPHSTATKLKEKQVRIAKKTSVQYYSD